MVASADRGAFSVELGADILAAAAIEHEGDTPAFSFAVPMMVRPCKSRSPSVEKSVLVACDICHSDAIEIVDRGVEPDRGRYIAGAGFEA